MFCLRPFRICAHHRPSCGNNAGEECLRTSVHGSGCNAEGLCRNAGPFLIEIFVWTQNAMGVNAGESIGNVCGRHKKRGMTDYELT